MLQIAIDGACRGNGKEECRSGSGVFIYNVVEDSYCTLTSKEDSFSSNQRGEIIALIKALDYVLENETKDALIISDSEYVFNTITKEWYKGWISRGWMTKEMTPVKNKDLWVRAVEVYSACLHKGIEVMLYHIKGHVVSIGEVTASNHYQQDITGRKLLNHCQYRYREQTGKRADKIDHALDVFERNNGFRPDEEIFERFVTMNCAVDCIANSAL